MENSDLEVVLAHELGHKALRAGLVSMTGINQEAASDHFAALVTSPQRVVDWLQNLILWAPENNVIQTETDNDPHPTAYERALAVAANCPGQVNLDGFRVPWSPQVTVNDRIEPIPVVPASGASQTILKGHAENAASASHPNRASLKTVHAELADRPSSAPARFFRATPGTSLSRTSRSLNRRVQRSNFPVKNGSS